MMEVDECISRDRLDEELLHSILHVVNLGLELRALIRRNRDGDHGARHSRGASESGLRRDEHVGDVLLNE